MKLKMNIIADDSICLPDSLVQAMKDCERKHGRAMNLSYIFHRAIEREIHRQEEQGKNANKWREERKIKQMAARRAEREGRGVRKKPGK